MGERYANVTVSHEMHSDRRFDLLAELGGWTRNDACWRMVQLWARCTAMQTDCPPPDEIRIHLGMRGEQLLVDAALAERRTDGVIRVLGGGLTGGDTDRFSWYAPVTHRNVAGGLARAATASRGARGRFVAGASHGQHDHQRTTSDASQTPASYPQAPASGFRIPEIRDHSLSRAISPTPGDGGEPGTRHPRPYATQQGAATPGQSASSAAGNVAEPHIDPTPDRVESPPSPGPLLLDVLWAEFELERQRVAKALRIELLPLAAHDRGRGGLADALSIARGAGQIDLETKRIRLAIAVAGSEAEGYQDSQWLTGAIFTGDNLRRLSSTTPAKAKQVATEKRIAAQQRAARAIGSQPAIAPPRRKEPLHAPTSSLTPEERIALAAESRAQLYGEARAGPASAPPREPTDDEPTDESTA